MDMMFWVMTIGGLLITIVVVAGAGFTMYRVFGGLHKTAAEETRILQTGTPARAQVMQIQMGGMTVTTGVHRRLQVVLTLQVQPPNGAPYVTQLQTLISELNIPQIQPGSMLQVRIDPMNPQKLAIEGFGVAPGPMPGSPPGYPAPGMALMPNVGQAPQPGMPYGAPPGAFGMPGAAPAAYGMSPGFTPAAPAAGFKLPLGAKIGLVVGGLGAVVGIGAAIVAVVWTMGVGGPSEICQKTADCCKKMSSSSPACDNYLKQTGPIADKVCTETYAAYQKTGQCK
jgi:hypothetical protein